MKPLNSIRLSLLAMTLAVLPLALPVHAANFVEYHCKSGDSGKLYKVLPEFGEIHELSATGELIGHQDSLSVEHLFLDTYPMTHIMKFIHEEGVLVAQISQRAGEDSVIKMDYFDIGDDSIRCKKSKPGEAE